jgi:hypothetical protein
LAKVGLSKRSSSKTKGLSQDKLNTTGFSIIRRDVR